MEITETQSQLHKEALLNLFEKASRDIEATFTSHDDDWEPILVLLGAEEQSKVVGFDPSYLSSIEKKEAWKKAMTKAIIDFKAVSAFITSSTWLRDPETNEVRGEALLCTIVTPHGSWSYMVDIHREDGEPPKLGKMEEMERVESSLVKALAEGIFTVLDEN